MCELDEFKAFFERMGMSYTEGVGYVRYEGGAVLSVAQVNFHFDEKMCYRGVEADEMDFAPREGSNKWRG